MAFQLSQSEEDDIMVFQLSQPKEDHIMVVQLSLNLEKPHYGRSTLSI